MELEATPGEPPHAVQLLQLPVYDMTKWQRGKYIKHTALMADPGSSTPSMLVAAMEAQYGNTVLTYDMETLRVRQRLFGHLYEITDIAVPPPSWQGAPLFATASKTGDVKVRGWRRPLPPNTFMAVQHTVCEKRKPHMRLRCTLHFAAPTPRSALAPYRTPAPAGVGRALTLLLPRRDVGGRRRGRRASGGAGGGAGRRWTAGGGSHVLRRWEGCRASCGDVLGKATSVARSLPVVCTATAGRRFERHPSWRMFACC